MFSKRLDGHDCRFVKAFRLHLDGMPYTFRIHIRNHT